MANTFNLYWIAGDRQAAMMMGEFATLADARNAQPAAEQEIIDQGGAADGYWSIDERDEDGDTVATHDA